MKIVAKCATITKEDFAWWNHTQPNTNKLYIFLKIDCKNNTYLKIGTHCVHVASRCRMFTKQNETFKQIIIHYTCYLYIILFIFLQFLQCSYLIMVGSNQTETALIALTISCVINRHLGFHNFPLLIRCSPTRRLLKQDTYNINSPCARIIPGLCFN